MRSARSEPFIHSAFRWPGHSVTWEDIVKLRQRMTDDLPLTSRLLCRNFQNASVSSILLRNNRLHSNYLRSSPS